MEFLLFKALGYAVIVTLPAWLILQLVPEPIARLLRTKIWDDPDR